MSEQTQDAGSANRLLNESSPYLLQHAYNPVDWFPWGDEAFEKARQEEKPIFLSVGYSACHWCHVMEHESFENDEIAQILNEHYVSIKVDREERPDVDQFYSSSQTSGRISETKLIPVPNNSLMPFKGCRHRSLNQWI